MERIPKMKLDKIVCHCKRVTNGDIKTAVEQGARTFAEVQEKTGVGRGCKRCIDAATRVMEDCIEELQA